MRIISIKHKIARLDFIPQDVGTVSMLAGCATTVFYDVLAVCGVVKDPIHEAGAVEAEGAVGAGGLAAFGPYLLKLAPSGIPAKHTGFPAPKVVDLADKRKGIADYLLSL